VAVFGGSVAIYFSVYGREALARTLVSAGAFRGRRVHLQCFAIAGFKQPQMAAALTYLLALGNRFDIVIELDGFNDVALSSIEHRLKGTFPAYPREWDVLVGQAPEIEVQARIGAVTYLEGWRGRLAGWFSRRPFRWSVTAGLVWKCLDRLMSAELGRARRDLATLPTKHGGYRERGPLRQYATDRELFAEVTRVWAQSSLQMQRLSAGAGMRYYHFLQPNQYLPGSKPMGATERALAYRPDHEYRAAVEQGYPLLQAEAARLASAGVDFHDLSQIFATITEPLYIDDCCHVNARANTILGETMGGLIAAGRREERLVSEDRMSPPPPVAPSTAQIMALPEDAFRVEWIRNTVPRVIRAGTSHNITVTFRNLSKVPWLDPKSNGSATGAGAVRLGYRWWPPSSQVPLNWTPFRADLERPLEPGQAATLTLAIVAPQAPGEYRLQLDLLQELVAWFEAKGASHLLIPVRVQ